MRSLFSRLSLLLLLTRTTGSAQDVQSRDSQEELCRLRPASPGCLPAAAGAGGDFSTRKRRYDQPRIISMMEELEAVKAQLQKTPVLTLPLTFGNIIAIGVLLSFSSLGCIFVWKLITRKSCNCKLCTGGYVLQHSVGTGGYGTVYLVTRKSDGHTQELVLKKIKVDDITDANFAQAEAHELRALQHPRIVAYEDDFVHTEWVQEGILSDAVRLEPQFFLMIVMEYCPEGDLGQRIALAFDRVLSDDDDEVEDDDLLPLPEAPERHEPAIAETQVLMWVGQMADALSFVHSHNIIHRDIKSQNFFVNAQGELRLGDFGLCRKALPHTITVGGTDVYMAPEMVLGQRYGKSADIWALGCVLWECCTGKFMWEIPGILGAQAGADATATEKLLRVLPTGYSAGLRELIAAMLNCDPSRRPSAAQICRLELVGAALPLAERKALGHYPNTGTAPSPYSRAAVGSPRRPAGGVKSLGQLGYFSLGEQPTSQSTSASQYGQYGCRESPSRPRLRVSSDGRQQQRQPQNGDGTSASSSSSSLSS